ncbi:unnamed protein product [Didymodactylos carnosus]|uniref:non-specific serine/threonine protein kinase n=1 Tax=Didymodactylos carnosus TaxID=1234261 RepID=A0A813ZLR4_9BILA|nr:unnamed protein product [Didymodactylos carnosus]CAF0977965.1 unnamed protein product [Didymodactylos carnosus]CAF3684442.1 unnamed protein product [Didymodactylos carnosus]CAF3748563.1 unnamed protein product [Didymodactylos carnosus]
MVDEATTFTLASSHPPLAAALDGFFVKQSPPQPPLVYQNHHHQPNDYYFFQQQNQQQPTTLSSFYSHPPLEEADEEEEEDAATAMPRQAHFGLVHDDDEEEDNTNHLLNNHLTPVTIQRVDSLDEQHLYLKKKRAKFVGPYLFGDVIGQGSYAKVKECLDKRNLCRRAVKIMQRRRLRKTPQGEKMAYTEIRILRKLKHPNVIQLYDFIRNDEKQKLYLFIDLCVVSLQEMLEEQEKQSNHLIKSFPTWQAHGYFIQLINGLEYLHTKFIIHNDIKPGNLLITVDHTLKISDFGTAEELDIFSVDDTIKRSQGTPAFQCPEIANGDETYNGYCIDIWACGVTLYNLVTGLLPFEADNIYLLFQVIGFGKFVTPDDIEPNLANLINGLLCVDKTKRLTIEQIRQHEWYKRRPPKTFDFVPFPKMALNRFQTLTMYDYLVDLHQPLDEQEDKDEDENLTEIERKYAKYNIQQAETNSGEIKRPTFQIEPEDDNENESHYHRRRRSKLNCGSMRCTRTNRTTTDNNNGGSSNMDDESIITTKKKRTRDHRLCALS